MTEEGRKRGCGHWLSLHCCCCEGLWPAPSMAAHRQQLGRHPLEQPWLPQMLSLVTFSWLDPLFRQGRRRRIDAADLLPVPRSDSAQTATDDIETQWQGMLARQRRPRAAFMRAAVWSSWRVFMAAGVALLAEAALLLLAPWLLSRLLAELAKRAFRASHGGMERDGERDRQGERRQRRHYATCVTAAVFLGVAVWGDIVRGHRISIASPAGSRVGWVFVDLDRDENCRRCLEIRG